jgi:hypothetical protein
MTAHSLENDANFSVFSLPLIKKKASNDSVAE